MKEIKDKYKEYDVTFLCPSESLAGEYRLTMEGNGKTLVGEYRLDPKGACGCVRKISKSNSKEDDELLNKCFEHFCDTIMNTGDISIKKAQLIFQEQESEFLYKLYRVPELRNPFGFYVMVVTKDGEDASLSFEVTRGEGKEINFEFERSIGDHQFKICEKMLMHVVGEEFDSFFSQKDFSGAS